LKNRASLFIALRYLWGKARESGHYLRGAATGIAVSLIPIIVTLIVADGMIRGITDRYLELGTGHLQIFISFNPGNGGITADTVSNINGVRGVWREKKTLGVLAGKDGKTGVTVRAIDTSFWDYPEVNSLLRLIDGKGKPENERDIVLGEALAKNIGARKGDTVRLMTLRNAEGGRLSPGTAAFNVAGIVSCGYSEIDSVWCVINLEGGKRVLPGDNSSYGLIVKIDDPYNKADEMAWTIYSGTDSSLSVYTWKELLLSQYSSYMSTRQLLLFIMALIVLVAAVNVSAATGMLALERQKDIAVLKVTGAGIRGVTGIFLWGSFLTGLAGAIIGISLGLLIACNINILIRSLEKLLSFFSHLLKGGDVNILDPGFYLETIPVIIDWTSVFLIGFFTILCSVTASYLPARRAGKLKPMELIRKNQLP
jgi:lipoprotein-releasing system permease protein